MRFRKAGIWTTCACVLTAWGCSSSSSSSGYTDTASAADTGATADSGGGPDAGSTDSGGTADTGPAEDTAASGLVVTIKAFAYDPDNLTVPAGSTVAVKNLDTAAHTVTSEAKVGDFTPGGQAGVTFDTGSIAAGAAGSFTIPASAPSGTVIPYYCTIHKAGMKNTGLITVK